MHEDKVESVQDFTTKVIMKQWHSHLDAQMRLLDLHSLLKTETLPLLQNGDKWIYYPSQ